MRQLKVTDEEKEIILQEAKVSLENFKAVYNFYVNQSKLNNKEEMDLQVTLKKINNLTNEISRLEQYGVISQTLLRLINIPFFSIELTPEIQDQIKKDIANTKDKEYFEEQLQKGKIGWNTLKSIYEFENIKNNPQIMLDKELLQRLSKMQDFFIQGKGNKIDLSKGNLSFSDFTLIAYTYLTLDMKAFVKKEILELQTRYNEGLISEDELWHIVEEQMIPETIQNFEEKVYRPKRENAIKSAIREILECQPKLQGKVSNDIIKQINQVLQPIVGQSLDSMDIDKAEQIVEKYNEISNRVWQEYLNEKDKFLFHTSRYKVEGEYSFPIMSTSLCFSTNTRELGMYGTDSMAYIIRPKHIMCADSKDLYINNELSDKYAAKTFRVVKFPQIIEEESRNNPDFKYSEIVCDEFEFEGVVYFYGSPNEMETKKLQERAEEIQTSDGKPLSVKFLTEYGLVTAQERDALDYERDRNTAYEELNLLIKNCNDLLDRRANFSKLAEANKFSGYKTEENSESQSINELFSALRNLNFSELNSTELKRITLAVKDRFPTKLWEELDEQDNRKYLEALNTRVQDLIIGAKKSSIDNQIETVAQEKVNILQRLFGKARLNETVIQNLQLQKKLILPERPEELTEDSIMQKLFDYIQDNGMTPRNIPVFK